MHCSTCGNKLNPNAKFCGKCGKAVDAAKEAKESEVLPTPKKIGKWKKSIVDSGKSSIALGWIAIVLAAGLFIGGICIGILKPFEASYFLGLIVSSMELGFGFFLITYGKRLKNPYDAKLEENLRTVLWASAIFVVVIVMLGSSPGLLFIILIIECFIAQSAIKKLKLLDEYNSQVISVKYEIRKAHRVTLIVIAAIILIVSFWAALLPGGSTIIGDGGQATVQNQEWKQFTPTDSSFTILFPVAPKTDVQSSQPGDAVSFTGYIYSSAPNDSVAYLVSYTEYLTEIDASSLDENLNKVVGGLAAVYPGSKLVSSDFINFDAHRGMDFLIDMTSKGMYLRGRVTMIGQKLYVAYETYKVGSYNEADYARFINSFHIK